VYDGVQVVAVHGGVQEEKQGLDIKMPYGDRWM